MSIEKMQLVNIAGKLKNLDAVIEKCIDSKCFHIESAVSDTDNNGFSLPDFFLPDTLRKFCHINDIFAARLCQTSYKTETIFFSP